MHRTTTDTFDEAAYSTKKLTAQVYALQAIGLFIGITYIAAAIINYVKADDVKGNLA